MKISLTPISFAQTIREGDMDVEGFVRFCAEQELDGVDMLDTRGYPWIWRDPARELKALPGWLRKCGLELAAWATGNDFARTDPDAFSNEVEAVKFALREAAEQGAPVLRIFGGKLAGPRSGGEEGIRSDNGLELVRRGIEQCLPVAEECRVVMAIENHGGLPKYSHELLALIEAFDSPYVKCTFDCGNFMANPKDEPEDPLEAYACLLGQIAHVHMKDNAPSEDDPRVLFGSVAGAGVVPIRQCVARLERDGYEGFCALEYEGGRSAPEHIGIPQSLDYLKGIRATHRCLRAMTARKRESDR